MEEELFFEEQMEQPTGERWDPLGAPDDQENELNVKQSESYCCNHLHCANASEKLKLLEDEQEQLNSSLFALTTHFAQVQFRLRQIVDASPEDKELLLKNLEEFACRGIPDVGRMRDHRIDEIGIANAMRLRKVQQQELIEKLKTQLRELEQYAFDSGEAGVPQDIVLERQRAILNELKMRMNLQLDEQKYHQLTAADVKQQVDLAMGQLVSPLRMKEHLVAQLKTQVADLERFINYLQADTKKQANCSCGCALHSIQKPTLRESASSIVQRTAALLQMFAMVQLGCGSQHFKKNNLKTTMKANHWGDMRARLEMSVNRIVELLRNDTAKLPKGKYTSDHTMSTINYNVHLTKAVRKYLSTSIRDLMQHGADTHNGGDHSLVPFIACFPRRQRMVENPLHAWEIIMQYYELKNGERFNSTPARKLSQSFNLEIAGAASVSHKHHLLSVIGNIITTHSPYKRGYDSHFKAFICAALNSRKLVTWLSLIFECRPLIEVYYHPWSYVAKTGFRDSLHSLDVLTKYHFDLPVDLAIRQFQNIKDAFT